MAYVNSVSDEAVSQEYSGAEFRRTSWEMNTKRIRPKSKIRTREWSLSWPRGDDNLQGWRFTLLRQYVRRHLPISPSIGLCTASAMFRSEDRSKWRYCEHCHPRVDRSNDRETVWSGNFESVCCVSPEALMGRYNWIDAAGPMEMMSSPLFTSSMCIGKANAAGDVRSSQ